MIKIKKKSIFIIVCIYVVSLLALLPARLPLSFVPEQVSLKGVSGTIWNGRIETVRFRDLQLEQFKWDVHGLAFLWLSLDVDVSFGGTKSVTKGKANLLLSPVSMKVEDASFDTDLRTLISGLKIEIPYSSPEQLNGHVSLLLQEYAYDTPYCKSLTAHFESRDLDYRSQFGDFLLGDFAVDLACQEGVLQITADKSHNDLGLNAKIELSPDQNFTILGSIEPTEKMPPDLKSMLGFLGQPDSSGRYPLEFQGKLP